MSVEDFTDYVEVDPNNKITVTSTRIESLQLSTLDIASVSKDKTVGHFGDFEHLVTCYVYGTSDDYYNLGVWGMSNTSFTRLAMDANNEGLSCVFAERITYARTSLKDWTNDNSDYSNLQTIDDPHYLTIKRSGNVLTCKIYTDPARTVLDDTLTLTCGTGTYRYIFGFINANAKTWVGEGYSENLDLQEVLPRVPKPTVAVGNPLMF